MTPVERNPWQVRIGQRWKSKDKRRQTTATVVDVWPYEEKAVLLYDDKTRRVVKLTSFGPSNKRNYGTRGYELVEDVHEDS